MINGLNELRFTIGQLLEQARELKRYRQGRGDVPSSEPVAIIFHCGELLVCWKRDMPDEAALLFSLTETDRKKGMNAKKMKMCIAHIADYLRTKGLYNG